MSNCQNYCPYGPGPRRMAKLSILEVWSGYWCRNNQCVQRLVARVSSEELQRPPTETSYPTPMLYRMNTLKVQVMRAVLETSTWSQIHCTGICVSVFLFSLPTPDQGYRSPCLTGALSISVDNDFASFYKWDIPTEKVLSQIISFVLYITPSLLHTKQIWNR